MCWCVKGVNGELVLGGISVDLICFLFVFYFSFILEWKVV